METVQGFLAAAQACCAYSITPVAAELLASEPGPGSITDFFRRLGRRQSAAMAFQAAFGVTLGDFYAEFASQQSEFSQQHTTHPGLQFPTSFADGAAPVSITEATTPVVRGAQGVLKATTGPRLGCTLAVRSSQGQTLVSAPAHADPAGNVFWLFTIPLDASMGTATAEVQCGEQPNAAEFEVG